MRAILTFLVLTVACLGLSAGLIAIAAYSNARRPPPPPTDDEPPLDLLAAFLAPEPVRVDGGRPVQMRRAVFRSPVPPTPDDEAEFRAVFDSLRQALADSDRTALQSLFDLDRLALELEPFGVFEVLPGGDTPAGRAVFIRGMKEGLARALIENSLFRWERTQVRWVQRSVDGREAVVTAYHRSAILGNRALKIRWWLIRGPEDWYVYDLEELDLGMRMSSEAGATGPVIFRHYRDNPGRLLLAISAIREAITAIVLREDVDEADEKLQNARGLYLPAPLAALREMTEGMILLGRGAPEAALKRLDEAERLQPSIPALKALRGSIEAALGRYAEALRLIDQYLAEVGPDPDAYEVRGLALEGLDRIPEAIVSYRLALDDLPDLVDAIHGLRRVLEKDQKREIALRVSRTTDPLATFDVIYWQAREDNDTATIDALKAWLRRAYPDDPRWIRMELSDLIESGRAEEAGAVLRERLSSRQPDELKLIALRNFIFSMTMNDRHLEAYAAIPADRAPVAYRLLADHADSRIIPLPLDPADRTVKLQRDLAALHRKRAPDDPWLLYFEGQTLWNEGRFAEAERKFAAGHPKVPPRPKADDADPDDDDSSWDAGRFRMARVFCLYQLKQGLRAYAEVGPVAETFSQLAFNYYYDKDAAGLEALLAAHRKREPKDRQLLYWSAELSYLREKYPEASEAFLKFLAESGPDEQNRWAAVDHGVRGYLRAKTPARAQEAIAAIGVDKVHFGLRAAVHLANNRADLAEAILAEESKRLGGHDLFYYDEDFARLIKQSEFESLRKKYPDPRTTPTGEKPG